MVSVARSTFAKGGLNEFKLISPSKGPIKKINSLIDCGRPFRHKNVDFTIRFSANLQETSKKNDLVMYWPSKFNYTFTEDISGTLAAFDSWAAKSSYISLKEVVFGQDMRSNTLFNPKAPFERKFLAHRYALMFYLFDDMYEDLMSEPASRDFAGEFARNTRAILSNNRNVKDIERFRSERQAHVDKALNVQRSLVELVDEATRILPRTVLERWFEINFITYTTCQIEAALWRQKVTTGQFVSRREYSDVKRFNSAFHSVLYLLLDDSDIVYYPIDEPLVANASIAMCLDNDIFSYLKEEEQINNPYNTIKKFISSGLSTRDAYEKLIAIRNDMVRSIEVIDTYLPEAQQEALMKSHHFLGGLLNYHSTCHRFGWYQ